MIGSTQDIQLPNPIVVNPDHFDAIPDPGCLYILGKAAKAGFDIQDEA
jgi:hypothetical protein